MFSILKKVLAVLIILAFATATKSHGQQSLFRERHKWGFALGYGEQAGLNVNYFYKVYQLQYQYYFTLVGKEKWALEFLAQPQFNFSRFKEINDSPTIIRGHEFGLNGGFLVRWILMNDRFSPYFFISAGPHYVSGVPERQSPGFIFSDNFFSGMSIGLSDSFFLDLRFGFRHISNAGLQNPNGGVNNFVGNAGFFVAF
ncbi:hypothetical protein ES705_33754 [subsurface metagenome]